MQQFDMSSFLVTDAGVVLVDAPPSVVDALLDNIDQITDKPIISLIYSHKHSGSFL